MIRKLFLYCTLFSVLLISCKKNTDTPIETIQPDSLGTGWSKVDIGADNYFSDIFFIGNMGFGAGRNQIFRSADGGDTWNVIKTTALTLINISMWDANNAIVVSQSNTIYFTNNGGDNFDSVVIEDTQIRDVFFINRTTAYIIG